MDEAANNNDHYGALDPELVDREEEVEETVLAESEVPEDEASSGILSGSLMGAGLGSGVFGMATQARAPSPVLQFVRK